MVDLLKLHRELKAYPLTRATALNYQEILALIELIDRAAKLLKTGSCSDPDCCHVAEKHETAMKALSDLFPEGTRAKE